MSRFLDGLASAAELDRSSLNSPGVTVVGREDRAGSSALACYWTGEHLVAWGDPAIIDRVNDAGIETSPAPQDPAGFGQRLAAAKFEHKATVITNLLAGPPSPPTPPAELAGSGNSYDHRWLAGDDPATLEAVRAFADRCDPDDVEAADLDELDDFAEQAINVVAIPGQDPLHIVAYASACEWGSGWDAEMADIGVLVHGDHRKAGLARFVVANTVAQLLDDGRVPLYRHESSNQGSAAVAAGVGFRPVSILDYFVFTG